MTSAAALSSKYRYYSRLLFVLSKRDFLGDMKDAWLGTSWILLQPILLMITFSAVRAILKFDVDGLPYPLTSYTAITVWLLHASIVQGATPAIERNGGIIKKMPVPRILFPLLAAVVCLMQYAVTWIPLIGLLMYYQWHVSLTLLYVPVLLFFAVVFSLGLALIVSGLGVFKRDILLALPYIFQLWFFLSPVIYPISRVPEEYLPIYELNPMVGIIENMRNVVLKDLPPDWSLLIPTFVGIAIVWAFALLIYPRFSRYFADVL